MESTREKVVITGVSGFLGSWVLKKFVEQGQFSIRGTVRDPNNEKKIAPLRECIGEEEFKNIELVAADLLDDASIDKAIEGCQYVVHTASPFPDSQPKDEDKLIKPALEGTLSV